MSTVKFRKVPELFPNCKVRTVRTEQLWFWLAVFTCTKLKYVYVYVKCCFAATKTFFEITNFQKLIKYYADLAYPIVMYNFNRLPKSCALSSTVRIYTRALDTTYR